MENSDVLAGVFIPWFFGKTGLRKNAPPRTEGTFSVWAVRWGEVCHKNPFFILFLHTTLVCLLWVLGVLCHFVLFFCANRSARSTNFGCATALFLCHDTTQVNQGGRESAEGGGGNYVEFHFQKCTNKELAIGRSFWPQFAALATSYHCIFKITAVEEF